MNPNSFDGHGNYTLGLAEQVVFPEIDADKLQHTQGMDITIVTTSAKRRPGPRAAPRLRHAVPPARPEGAQVTAIVRSSTAIPRPDPIPGFRRTIEALA